MYYMGSAYLKSMHDKVIQIFFVVEEMAEFPGHALLHAGLLCADEAFQHHPTHGMQQHSNSMQPRVMHSAAA